MTLTIPLLNGDFTVVDDDDYEDACQFLWRRNFHGYAMYAYTEKGKRREVFLHRYITDAPVGMVVDHLDHNRLMNVRSNLRLCSVQENLRYRQRFRNNDCGLKGVTAWRGRWSSTTPVLRGCAGSFAPRRHARTDACWHHPRSRKPHRFKRAQVLEDSGSLPTLWHNVDTDER